jgi:hypothetical protein
MFEKKSIKLTLSSKEVLDVKKIIRAYCIIIGWVDMPEDYYPTWDAFEEIVNDPEGFSDIKGKFFIEHLSQPLPYNEEERAIYFDILNKAKKKNNLDYVNKY